MKAVDTVIPFGPVDDVWFTKSSLKSPTKESDMQKLKTKCPVKALRYRAEKFRVLKTNMEGVDNIQMNNYATLATTHDMAADYLEALGFKVEDDG